MQGKQCLAFLFLEETPAAPGFDPFQRAGYLAGVQLHRVLVRRRDILFGFVLVRQPDIKVAAGFPQVFIVCTELGNRSARIMPAYNSRSKDRTPVFKEFA